MSMPHKGKDVMLKEEIKPIDQSNVYPKCCVELYIWPALRYLTEFQLIKQQAMMFYLVGLRNLLAMF